MAEEGRDWSKLPSKVMVQVLKLLGTKDRLRASYVCKRWLNRARAEKDLWRVIEIVREHERPEALTSMCREAARRSSSGCVELTMRGFGTSGIITYLLLNCQLGKGLKRLRLEGVDLGVNEFVDHLKEGRLSQLHELEFTRTSVGIALFKSIRTSCPNLRILKVDRCLGHVNWQVADQIARAIGSIEQIEELSLQGCNLSCDGLLWMAMSLPNLLVLDLRGCRNLTRNSPVWQWRVCPNIPTVLFP